MRRGVPLNGKIIDETGTIAARTCASGMMAGITSPSRPWFKLKMVGYANNEDSNPVSLWLSEVERRMMRVFNESNFYTSMAVMYQDLCVFGTATMLIYEDYDDVVRCVNPAIGEFFLQNDSRLEATVFARKFVMNPRQLKDEYGDAVSANVNNSLKSRGGNTSEFVICQIIQRNNGEMPKKFKFCEYTWEETNNSGKFLRVRGYYDQMVICPRWETAGNDAYGRSPGMDALPGIKQLQQETKRKAQAIDKMVNPPLVADVSLKNQPASQLPGGITYVSGSSQVGMKPLFTVMPPVQEMMLDIAEIQKRIQQIFFNDLFMMISQLQTVRSATEIDARREEKLVMLGPVLERFFKEGLDKAVKRTFGIMSRGGLLPESPPEVAGAPIQIQYTSMLAEAQKASSTAGIERILGLTGNLVGVVPDIMDTINTDEAIAEFGDLLSVAPKVIRTKEEIKALREARNQANQQAQALQATDGLAKAAKNLAATDVGGGNSALAAIMGGV
jgi:hypothetical protein